MDVGSGGNVSPASHIDVAWRRAQRALPPSHMTERERERAGKGRKERPGRMGWRCFQCIIYERIDLVCVFHCHM